MYFSDRGMNVQLTSARAALEPHAHRGLLTGGGFYGGSIIRVSTLLLTGSDSTWCPRLGGRPGDGYGDLERDHVYKSLHLRIGPDTTLRRPGCNAGVGTADSSDGDDSRHYELSPLGTDFSPRKLRHSGTLSPGSDYTAANFSPSPYPIHG